MTIGQMIDKKYTEEDFTGMLGEIKEMDEYYAFPKHVIEFLDSLYDMGAKLVSGDYKIKE